MYERKESDYKILLKEYFFVLIVYGVLYGIHNANLLGRDPNLLHLNYFEMFAIVTPYAAYVAYHYNSIIQKKLSLKNLGIISVTMLSTIVIWAMVIIYFVYIYESTFNAMILLKYICVLIFTILYTIFLLIIVLGIGIYSSVALFVLIKQTGSFTKQEKYINDK